MISNIRRNSMGTISFDGKFDGMRKAQDFIVYPMHADNHGAPALVQSDTRIGRIDLNTGTVTLSQPRAGGSYNVHLMFAKPAGTLNSEELFSMKTHCFASAHGDAGTNGIVYTDNSGAIDVFGTHESKSP